MNTKKFSFLLSSFIAANALANIMFFINLDRSEWTLDYLIRRYVVTARVTYFLEDTDQYPPNWAPNWNEITYLDIFLTLLTFVGICFRQIAAYLADGFILVMAMFLWIPTIALKNLVTQQCQEVRIL